MSKTFYNPILAGLVLSAGVVRGADLPARLLGANSCASSSCHGGGGAEQNQFHVWSLKDVHSQRPFATLTTARSLQIAAALGISDPATEARCTTCHAPLQTVPTEARGEHFQVGEGVTCESCHGPAETWLRAHTRQDWTRADRTAAGMRDLQDVYVRANTCVACHQVVGTALLQAGHPELMFELDGQSVAEPKHWRTEKNGPGAQAWLVGQAVALREMSWEVAREPQPDAEQLARQQALWWLLQKVAATGAWPTPLPAGNEPTVGAVQKWADDFARAAANGWPEENSRAMLKALANSSTDFKNIPAAAAARRAERLVLALDRLALPVKNSAADLALNHLFQLAQSRPDFDAGQFAAALAEFSRTLAGR